LKLIVNLIHLPLKASQIPLQGLQLTGSLAMSGDGLIDQASRTSDEVYRQSEEGNDPCGQAEWICHVECGVNDQDRRVEI